MISPLLLPVIAAFFAATADSGRADAVPDRSRKKTVLLIARPADNSLVAGENAWLGAAAEQLLRFKLGAVNDIGVVPVEELLPGYQDLSVDIRSDVYHDVAVKRGASHIITQSYEIVNRGKDVQYILEVVSAADNRIALTIDKTFPVEDLAPVLDSVMLGMLGKLKITLSPKMGLFFRTPLIARKSGSVIGKIIIGDRFSAKRDYAALTRDYVRATQREKGNYLANYLGAIAANKAKDHGQAAVLLDELLLVVGPVLPDLYVQACDSYRMAQRFRDALRIATLGEQNGVKNPELMSVKAQIFADQGERPKAKEAYLKILAVDKNEPRALRFLAEQYILDSLPKEGLEMAERLLKLQPKNAAAWLEKGKGLSQLKQTDNAIEAFNKAVSLRADDPAPYAFLGDLYAAKENAEMAAANYEKAMKGMPDNLPLHFRAALAFRRIGRTSEAISVLRKIEPMAPGNPRLLRELGLLELHTRDSAKARTHLESFTKSGEKDAEVFLALGGIHANAGRRAEAVKMYKAALPLLAQKNDCRMALAKLMIADGDPKQATVYLKEIVVDKPSYPEVNRLLGDAALNAGDKAKARDYYLSERRHGGDSPYVQEKLGKIYFELGDWQNSRTEYLAFVKSGKPDAAVYFRLTTALLNLGVLPAAEEYFAKGLTLKQAEPELYLLFAKKYAGSGNPRKATELLLQCLAVAPNSEPALTAIAEVYSAAKKDSAAAETYLRLFQVNNEKHKALLVKAGTTFEGLGKTDKARECYELFLQKKYIDAEVAARLGMIHFRAGKLSEALAVLETVTGTRASETSLLMAKAEAYSGTDQCAKAVAALEAVLRTSPANARALELAAQCYEKTGALDRCAAMFERFLSTPATPKHQDYAFHVGELLEKIGRKQNARTIYGKNTARFPQDPRNHERYALLLFDAKEYATAIPVLQNALTLPNAPSQFLRLLAVCYSAVGEKANAAKYFSQYLKQSPNDTAALLEVSTYFYSKKQYPKAAENLIILTTLMPNNFDCHSMLGISYYQIGKYTEAAAELARANKLNEKHEPTVALLVRCYRALKDTKNLVEALKKHSSLRETDFDLKREVGTLLLAEGKTDEAVTYLEAASKLKPSQTDLHLTIAGIYKQKGNDQVRLSHLTEALRHNPNLWQVHLELGQYYRQKGDTRAVTHLKKAVDLNPKHGAANFEYGNHLLAAGDAKSAIKFLETAASIEPGNSVWLLAHAQALRSTGKVPAALSAVKRALAKDEKNPELLTLAGVLSLENQQTAGAKEFLQKAALANRECASCFESLGDIALGERNTAEAAKNYDLARGLDRNNGRVAFKLAKAYLAGGKYETAEAELEKTLSLDPDNQEALYLLCNRYLRRDETAKASTLFERFSNAKKTFWYFLLQGEVNEAKENADMALIGYSSAVRMAPENAAALAGSGRMYLRKGSQENALMNLSQALAYDENNAQVIRDLGTVYEAMKDDASAYKLYKEALRIDANDPDLHYAIARHESTRGSHQKAIDHLTKSIGINPKPAKYHLAIGFEYFSMKRWEPAIESFRLAARTGKPEIALEAYRQIGTIYFTYLKDPAKAKEFYSRFVREGGKDETVEARLKSL